MSAEQHVCIISGGSRGLGLGLVDSLLKGGSAVATFSRSPNAQTEAWNRGSDSSSIYWEGVDVASPDEVARFVRNVVRRFGRVDALVNNAGIAIDSLLPLMSPMDIQRVVNINVVGSLLLTRACTRVMLRQRQGAVVNISSVNGIRGASGVAAYGATKAALDGMTRCLARELGPRGIRVNSVCPGYVDTEMTKNMTAEQRARIVRRTPLGSLATVEDIVGVVQFLLSPASRFVTGQTLVVDGGMTC